MRTLIVAPDTLGQALQTQPVLARLRQMDPTGTLYVLAPRHLVALFECISELDTLLIYDPDPERHKLTQALSLMGQVLRLRLDRTWILADHPPLPWLPRLTSGVVQHLTPATALAQLNSAAPVALPTLPTNSGHQRRAADPNSNRPQVSLRRHPLHEAQARHHVGLAPHTPMVAFVLSPPDTKTPRWPQRHWASLLVRLRLTWPDVQPLLLGDVSERNQATEIAALSGGLATARCGTPQLSERLALLAQAEAVVAYSGEWSEAAAAFGRPVFKAHDAPEIVWARMYQHLEPRATRNLR